MLRQFVRHFQDHFKLNLRVIFRKEMTYLVKSKHNIFILLNYDFWVQHCSLFEKVP